MLAWVLGVRSEQASPARSTSDSTCGYQCDTGSTASADARGLSTAAAVTGAKRYVRAAPLALVARAAPRECTVDAMVADASTRVLE